MTSFFRFKSSTRNSSNLRGYNGLWQKARRTFLDHNPLCIMCLEDGVTAAATVVNHKVPHRGDQKLFWDQSNWEAVCKPHHDRHCQIRDNGGDIRRIDLDGWPVE